MTPHGQGRFAVAVLGPCASGKSTLVRALRRRGYTCREVAQEHSVVPDLWRRRGTSGPMIFLDVSPEVARRRRGLASVPAWWRSASARLAVARSEADLTIATDALSPLQVLDHALSFLASAGYAQESDR